MTSKGIAAASALALLAVLAPLAAQDGKAALARGPVVSLAASGPVIEVVVPEGTSDLTLRYKWPALDEARRAPFEAVSGRRLRAKLEGVPAATAVAYDVLDGTAQVVTSGTLDALPAADAKKLTFCALGDSGFPGPGGGRPRFEQLSIARLLDDQKPDLAIHTGDIVYLVGQPQGFDPLFFQPYAATLRRVPFFITLGNHDVKTKNGQPTRDEFPFPTNEHGNDYYSFDAANVHFACLDSNEVLKSESAESFLATAQGKWLKTDLAAAKSVWRIVFCHHPLFTVSTQRSTDSNTMRAILEKLLDEAGVDIVLTGHEHFYHRTERLRDGKPSAEGMVHIITGGGGAPLYKGEPKKDLTAAFASRFHLTRFDVEGLTMRVRAMGVDAQGAPEVFDEVTLTSRRAQ